MAIIDAHAHLVQCIAGTGSQGELRPCGSGKAVYATGQVIQMIPPELGEYDVTPEALLRIMDEHDIEKAVLLQGNYFGFQNLYTWEAIQKYPDRFTGAATYDPFSRQAEKIRTHLFDDLGFRIIKMEVSNGSGLMSYHPAIDLNGDVMHQVYRHAAERGLTFIIDIGRPGNDCWQVEALRKAILAYPDMKFVICHLLAPQLGDSELLKQSLERLALPNVWFDLAAVCANTKPETWPYETARSYVRCGIDIVGAHRLLWGSDMPSTLNRDTCRHLIDFVAEDPELTEEEKQRILYQNAKELFFT